MADNILTTWAHTLDAARQRRLRACDRESRAAMVRAILANLALSITCASYPPGFAVALRGLKQTRGRYARTPITPSLPSILDMLDTAGTLSFARSARNGEASTVTAASAIDLRRFKPFPEAFRRLPGGEVIRLTQPAAGRPGRASGRTVLLDYADTPEVRQMRAELVAINAFIAAADIAFVPDGGPPVLTGMRELHRGFNAPQDGPVAAYRWDRGGRLYSGFWMTLPRARRGGLRISGETIVDLDFSAMHLRLALIDAGLPPLTVDDPYALVEGFRDGRHRDGLKKVVSSMLARPAPMLRLPQDSVALLPPGTTAGEMRFVIGRAFPGIAFETGLAARLVHTESRILLAALDALKVRTVVALPMHDGLMTARSQRELAEAVMGDAAEAIVGVRLPVVQKL